MSETNYITEEWRQQGLDVRGDDHHVMELLKDGKVIATFSQKGVEIDNVLKEIKAGKDGN